MIRVLAEQIETGSDGFYDTRRLVIETRLREIVDETDEHWNRLRWRLNSLRFAWRDDRQRKVAL